MNYLLRFAALFQSSLNSTQARIVFMLSYGLCCGSCYSLFHWNEAASIIVLGYVVIAQVGVGAFFEHPCTDATKRFLVEFLALGYVIIGGLALILWNEKVTHEVLSGFTLFSLRIVKEYFQTPVPPTVTP